MTSKIMKCMKSTVTRNAKRMYTEEQFRLYDFMTGTQAYLVDQPSVQQAIRAQYDVNVAAEEESGFGYADSQKCPRLRILKVDNEGNTSVSLTPRQDAVLQRNTQPCKPMDSPTTSSLLCKQSKVGTVIYWMSRDQRTADNWALLRAQEIALARSQRLVVVFCLLLPNGFLPGSLSARHFGFMLRGLREVEFDLRKLHIPFVLLHDGRGPQVEVPEVARKLNASMVVSDFSPLRLAKQWREMIARSLSEQDVQFEVIDAHNVVPVWVASQKQEFGARTIRPKLWRTAADWIRHQFPSVQSQSAFPFDNVQNVDNTRLFKVKIEKTTNTVCSNGEKEIKKEITYNALLNNPTDWAAILKHNTHGLFALDWSVGEIEWLESGERAALKAVQTFLQPLKLKQFALRRNDPCERDACSNLSPYIHFGQIAPARVLQELMFYSKRGPRHFFVKDRKSGAQVFVEEFLIRRELSENFCYYCKDYDNINGAHAWAQKTISIHKNDVREYLYSRSQLAKAKTHDPLWNAAQCELVNRGKMAGFMRMYWAKKILEWTESTEQALKIAISLNDQYSLDGRDPNGYVGCMWSIVGTHDRAWTERPIFGKIRYMNYNGCKRKFDIGQYIAMNSVNPSTSPGQKKTKSKRPSQLGFKSIKASTKRLRKSNGR